VITVDPEMPAPPFEQIRSQLEARIRGGQLPGGSRLPTVRQLAHDLGVATGTVQAAYRALESSGLVEGRRSRGTLVAEGQVADRSILSAADALVAHAKQSGLGLEATVAIVRSEWNRR
jgi:GntR family transcriptional regulator